MDAVTRRCLLRCGQPALPTHDLCADCHAVRKAKARAKNRRHEKRRTRRHYVSLSTVTYKRLEQEAQARGQSVRSLLEEVLAS